MYTGTTEIKAVGVDEDGFPFDRLELRKTQCKGCGAWRIDREYGFSGSVKAAVVQSTGSTVEQIKELNEAAAKRRDDVVSKWF